MINLFQQLKKSTQQIATFALLMLLVASLQLSVAATPKIEEWKTAEGAKVLYMHAPEIPMMDLIVALDAGSFREGKEYGLALLTANMMARDNKQFDEESLMTTLENMGTSISAGAGTNHTFLSYRSLTDEKVKEDSLAIFYDIITSPRFEPSIFERERAQIIDAQKARLDNPNAIASELYYATLYPGQYLGVTSEMLQESLSKITLEQLKAFREQYYNAQNAKIIFVGALEKAEVEAIAAKISSLLGEGDPLPKIAEPAKSARGEVVEKFFPSPQTRIMIGHPSITREHEDYFPLLLGNHLFGGSGLTSQLMIEIREKRGLTYGIYSGFSPSFLPGPFTISLSTKNESVDEAIRESRKLLEQFIENGPNEEQLQLAKNNLVGSMVLDLDSNSKLAGALLTIATYDLPLDYYERYPEKIRAITAKEIQAAFKRAIDLEALTTIIVGGAVEEKEQATGEEDSLKVKENKEPPQAPAEPKAA